MERTPMTAERAKQISFCVLQYIRQNAEKDGKDPVDFDDELFSNFDIEIGELEEIYKPYPEIIIYAGSCYEDEHSPKDFDKRFFCN